ncbi:MAG TPA: hypothetical protein VFT22_01120 [Kofleriaceae bacterium]|nr:hypothetical protein [Kofleriaceae bacterium]
MRELDGAPAAAADRMFIRCGGAAQRRARASDFVAGAKLMVDIRFTEHSGTLRNSQLQLSRDAPVSCVAARW